MISVILTECLKTYDNYKLFDRTEELFLFLLVDDYGSRFELESLQYISGHVALEFLMEPHCGKWETVCNKMDIFIMALTKAF